MTTMPWRQTPKRHKSKGMFNRLGKGFWRLLAPSELVKERRCKSIVTAATAREDELKKLSDDELLASARKLHTGEAFSFAQLVSWGALGREASRRGTKLRPFDVQLLGALRMLTGEVVEMATGEGKTLSGALAAAGYVMQGHKVHVVTINDYLARRDAEWMAPLFDGLGVSTGWIDSTSSPQQRREAYDADVCYVAISEAGFDVLRDRQATDPADLVVPTPDVALIDEIDSVLVDEARVPLVLAGEDDAELGDTQIAKLVATLNEREHYEIDTDGRNVYLTAAGSDLVAEQLGDIDLYSAHHVGTTLTKVNVALHARAFVHRDVHYLVRDDSIALINPARGRVATRQRWPDGLHSAIEAKEGVTRTPESKILDSLTVHAVVTRYETLCGMTGTAVPAAEPLHTFYGLYAAVIPPNEPCQRVDDPDRIYTTSAQRDAAVLDEIKAQHETGRPVLVATLDVAESERISKDLSNAGLQCTVLNARNDAHEATVIADAGIVGAITISTQLAGRGTDIRLGGAEESDHDAVAELGGLYVLGTGHQPSQRLDNQLRGRAGRQGDPGGSVFFVSLEDEMIEQYGTRLPSSENAGPEGLIISPTAQRAVDRAQRRHDGVHHDILTLTAKYNVPIDRQREFVGDRRDTLLHTDAAATMLASRCPDQYEWFAEALSPKALEDLCRQVVLFTLDQYWSEHLALAAELRDGLQLRALMSRLNPLTEFLREMFAEFEGFLDRIDDEAAERFDALPQDADIDINEAGIKRPTATWTYLVQDNPFGNEFERTIRGMARTMHHLKPKSDS